MKKIFPAPYPKALTLLFLSFILLITSTSWAEEKIEPNDMGEWIIDGFAISMHMKCNISIYNFWPKKHCNKPYVEIYKKINSNTNQTFTANPYFQLVVDGNKFGDKWIFDDTDDPQRRVPMSEITLGRIRSEDLFTLLAAEQSVQIKFMTRLGQGKPINSKTIILSGFNSYAEKTIKSINNRYSMEESKARKKNMIAFAALGGFLVAIFFLVRFLIKRARKKIKIVKQNLETKRVSRVAEDEAIREVVRNTVQNADDQSLAVLKEQIKKALDAGDTKTAEELLRIMNRLS